MSKANRFPALSAPQTDEERRRLARAFHRVQIVEIVEIIRPSFFLIAALVVIVGTMRLVTSL